MGYFAERHTPRASRSARRAPTPYQQATAAVLTVERLLLGLYGSERDEVRELISAVLEHVPAETTCIEPGCTAERYTRGGSCAEHMPASPFVLNAEER